MVVESFLESASSIGLLGLVASFFIAYWKYKRQRDDQREAVKRAIFTELLSTQHLDRAYSVALDDAEKDHRINVETNNESGVPVNQFLPTTIGQSYSDKFGLLHDEEIEAVTAYYSEVENLREVIHTRRMFEMSLKEGHNELVYQMSGVVAGEIKETKEKRDGVLRMWCSEFGYSLEDLKSHGIHVKVE